MKEKIITKELHRCDICNRRIPSPYKVCDCCGKEVCTYCASILRVTRRKYPDNGYLVKTKQIGRVCVKCIENKLKLKID